MAKGLLSAANVLVIDDDADVREALAALLESIGVGGVAAVENGQAAIEHLAQADPAVNVVICDILMPGMDGWEFVRRIRYGTDVPAYKNVPILMLTGADTPENVQRGKYHRIHAFLIKPLDRNTLYKHVLRALSARTHA